MAPPELAADAPVLDVAHPLIESLVPVRGHELHTPALHRCRGLGGQWRDADVPLQGEIRLDHRSGAIAARRHELVRLDALDQPIAFQLRDDALASLEAIQPTEAFGHQVIEMCVGRENVDQRQTVALPDRVVIEIMSRRYLDAAGTESRVDEAVGDDGYLPPCQRQLDAAPDQVPITLIRRVHSHGTVAEHGLRTRGRHDDPRGCAATVLRAAERIAQVPELALLLLGQHFQVRQCGAQHGVPVDQAFAPIDEALLVQPHESLRDRLRQARIEREALARPIHGGAQSAHLSRYRAAGLLLPCPDTLDKRLAAEIRAALALGVEHALDHHLGGNAGVIRPRLPQGGGTLHAVHARQGVHDRVLERVPHVQGTRDVRRRNHDGVAARAWARRKISGRFPLPIQALFDFGGRVDFIHQGSVLDC